MQKSRHNSSVTHTSVTGRVIFDPRQTVQNLTPLHDLRVPWVTQGQGNTQNMLLQSTLSLARACPCFAKRYGRSKRRRADEEAEGEARGGSPRGKEAGEEAGEARGAEPLEHESW